MVRQMSLEGGHVFKPYVMWFQVRLVEISTPLCLLCTLYANVQTTPLKSVNLLLHLKGIVFH